MKRCLLSLACSIALLLPAAAGATVSSTGSHNDDAQLRYVVYLVRHGVRSPTGKPEQYNPYSRALWPEWPVAPGYLTPHGFHLMELFGAFDRLELAQENLLPAVGCNDAANVTIYADSEQRTRETARALAQGLFPECGVPVRSMPEGEHDPLFHSLASQHGHLDPALARSAVAGRIGEDPANVATAYHSQIASLDDLLATCGAPTANQQERTSLFDIPARLSPGDGDHLVDLKGPLNTAATLAENLLLEYTEGMDDANVGWGCVHRSQLETLMNLHTAGSDFTQRTPQIARAQASNLLDHIDRSIKQSIAQKPVRGALGKPSDRALFLVGHDTNIENVAGLLDLNWITDGRRDDTPPGGALIFELWQGPKSGDLMVRTYYIAQTLEQMRSSALLDLSDPPDRVPVFVPGCSGKDFSCTWTGFMKTIQAAIDQPDIDAR
jgi:4-phytase/acid phosphatase